jgi:hypothetical protein
LSGFVLRRAVVAAVLLAAFGVPGPAYAASPGIEGTITNADTGAPVEGAFVSAFDLNGGYSGDASTDAAGHYDLYFLSPGSYRIRVLANEYTEQWAFGKPDQSTADPVVAPGTASLALQPLRYGAIAGRFVTDLGAPVANAGVEVYDLSQNQRDQVTTDADGAFRFQRLLVGPYKLHFLNPNGVQQWAYQKAEFFEADEIAVTADTETTVTEVALPTGGLEVTVTDQLTGAPVAGAFVLVSANGGPQYFFGATDATGRALFPALPAGIYRLSVSGPDGYLSGSADDVVVHAGETTRVAVPLTPAATIVIKVKDQHENPVAGACVYVIEGKPILGPNNTCSDSTGTVRLGNYPAGRWRLFVRFFDGPFGSQWVGEEGGTGDPDRATRITTTPGKTTTVRVRADRAGSISGVVTDAATGAAVVGLCTTVVSADAQSFEAPYGSHCTSGEGRYTINNLGPYAWKVEFPDYTGAHAWQWSGGAADRLAATPVRVRTGGTTRMDAALPAAGKVTGKIVNATIPWYYTTVVALNALTGEPAGPYASRTSDFGYTLSGLATQDIRIWYAGGPGGLVEYPSPVPVVAGQTVTGVDLVVPPGGT